MRKYFIIILVIFSPIILILYLKYGKNEKIINNSIVEIESQEKKENIKDINKDISMDIFKKYTASIYKYKDFVYDEKSRVLYLKNLSYHFGDSEIYKAESADIVFKKYENHVLYLTINEQNINKHFLIDKMKHFYQDPYTESISRNSEVEINTKENTITIDNETKVKQFYNYKSKMEISLDLKQNYKPVSIKDLYVSLDLDYLFYNIKYKYKDYYEKIINNISYFDDFNSIKIKECLEDNNFIFFFKLGDSILINDYLNTYFSDEFYENKKTNNFKLALNNLECVSSEYK